MIDNINRLKYVNKPFQGDLSAGQPVLLEFFQTWCPPCHGSIGRTAELQQKITTICATNESFARMREFYESHPGMSAFAVAVNESGWLARLVKQTKCGVPVVFLISAGAIVYKGNPGLREAELAIDVVNGGLQFSDEEMLEGADFKGRALDFRCKMLVLTYQAREASSDVRAAILMMLAAKYRAQANFVVLTGERESWAVQRLNEIATELRKPTEGSAKSSTTQQTASAVPDSSVDTEIYAQYVQNQELGVVTLKCDITLAVNASGAVVRQIVTDGVACFYIFGLDGTVEWKGPQINIGILNKFLLTHDASDEDA